MKKLRKSITRVRYEFSAAEVAAALEGEFCAFTRNGRIPHHEMSVVDGALVFVVDYESPRWEEDTTPERGGEG